MIPLDFQGRQVGGLFQACYAVNNLYKQRRLEYKHAHAIATNGKSLHGTGLVLVERVLVPPMTQLQAPSGSQPLEASNGRVLHEEDNPERKRRRKIHRSVPTITTTTTTTSVVDTAMNVEESGDLDAEPVPQQVVTGRRGKQGVEVYCVCKTPWAEDRFMIECDGKCKDWFHPECLGYSISKKKDITLVDVDGVRISNLQNYSFYCQSCELARGATGTFDPTEKRIPTGNRFFRWCDVADIGDACMEEQKDDATKDNPAAIRWKLLMTARSLAKIMAACKTCSQKHHPLLPCPSLGGEGSRGSSPKLDDSEVSEDTGSTLPVKLNTPTVETYGLIVGGKYQGLKGTVTGSSLSRKLHQLNLDCDSGGVRVIVPMHHVLVSKSRRFDSSPLDPTSPQLYQGVISSPNGGFLAHLDLDESNRIILGRFSSSTRAARARDVAMRLQYGDENLLVTDLNFPDLTRLNPQPSVKNQPAFSQVVSLVYQVSLGPFASSSSASAANTSDALHVLGWAENVFAALDEFPPYFESSQRVLLRILDAVSTNATEQATKLGGWLEKSALSASTNEEDELETLMKKYSRNRNAKQRQRGGGNN